MAATRPAGGRASGGTPGSLADWVTGALVVSIVTGIVAIFLDSPSDAQTIAFSIGAIASVIAAWLLTFWHVLAGRPFAAAGFAGLGVIAVAGQVAGYSGAQPEAVFANLGLLFAPGLILIAAENWAPTWARAAAGTSAVFFAIWSYAYVLGDKAADIESPILAIAFLFFTVANVGWILTVRAEASAAGT